MQEGGFPEIFRPLHPFRDRLVFMENISMVDANNSHRQTSGMLTGRRRHAPGDLKDYTSTGISVDHYLANEFEEDPELETHVLNTAFRIEGFATGEGYWSYTGPGERVEPLQNPVDAYTRVFGEGLDDEQAARLLAQRKTVLDVIAKDIGRMMQRVPAADRPRLEQHLDGVHELGQSFAASVCDGANPIESYDFLAQRNAPRVMRDHGQIITQAMACGYSRIATMQMGNFGGSTRPDWPELGVSHGGHTTHAICHAFAGIDGAGSDGLTAQQGRTLGIAKEVAFTRIFAEVLAQLDATPDVDGGTLLDNTLVIYARPMGTNHNSRNIVWIAAGGTGVGVSGGRWLTFPSEQKHYNDVLTAVCHAMGKPVDTFGDGQFCDAPMPLG